MKIEKLTIITLMALTTQVVCGQVTVDDNLPFANRYLGFDNNSTIDLPLENNGVRTVYSFEDWPGYNNIGQQLNSSRIHFPTDPLEIQSDIFSIVQIGDAISPVFQRDWMQVGTTYGAGGDLMYTGIIQDPANEGNQTGGDAVIAWGDNQNGGVGQGPDNFRLLFISTLTSAISGPNSDQGRETMRITPQGNIGMGDSFSNALQPSRRLVVHKQTNDPQFRIAWGLDNDPLFGKNADFQVTQNGVLHLKASDDTTRRPVVIGFLQGEADNPTQFTYLDVGGVTRIRNLPDTTKTCLVLGSIADTSAEGDVRDHYLTRLDFTGDSCQVLGGHGDWVDLCSGDLTDCRWEDVPSGTGVGTSDIRTGFDPLATCYRQNVVIGDNSAKSKFAVRAITERDNAPFASLFDITDSEPDFDAGANGDVVTAILASSDGINVDAGTSYAGIQSRASFGRVAVGLDARASGGANHSIGVYSVAANSLASPNPNANIAYYAEVPGSMDVSMYRVGGITVSTGNTINISDAAVKSNIQDITEATDVLSQLQPRTYNYISPENRPIAFEEEIQYGLVAQEVQEILPEIVYQTTVPEIRDSIGNFIEGTSVDLLGINYNALVPILIAGFQEQNATLEAQIQENTALQQEVLTLSDQNLQQEAEIASLQSQMNDLLSAFQSMQSNLNNCCGTAPTEKSHGESGKNELEQNFPNPFETETIINFTIYEPAQIRLEISDAQGRVLEVLVNGRLSAGSYTERWDASAYAPGTYFYSLYADTELLTKKMIKK